MARYTYCNWFILSTVMISLSPAACGYATRPYAGSIILTEHRWLNNKKVFIDPGHGGTGPSDRFRTGPNGIREDAVNLQVSRILAAMLTTAGARVEMSRSGDAAVADDDRVKKARASRPDLIISIHHAGSLRRADNVNYPTVLIWGSKDAEPASFDFAALLLDEFNKMIDVKGDIISDLAVNSEGGTTILRETRHICPSVIGEAGFYTSKQNSMRLHDSAYITREAEAYFIAISRYFHAGMPGAEVLFSCPVDNTGHLINMIDDETPAVTIRVYTGNETAGIDDHSLQATLDGIPVVCKKLEDNSFAVNYGPLLYPGFHRLRFQFRNRAGQSSMLLNAPFTVAIHEGDYGTLVREGIRRIARGWNVREGLKMLLAAHSMGLTEPHNGVIMRNISRGFIAIGDHASADYYAKKAGCYYSAGAMSASEADKKTINADYRFAVEFFGSAVNVTGDRRVAKKNPGAERR